MLLNSALRPYFSISSASLRAISTRFVDLVHESQPRENVLIQGRVQRAQTFGKKVFLKLTDGTSPHQIQAIVPRSICRTIWVGSAIQLIGKWMPSRGSEQEMEFVADECPFIGQPEEEHQMAIMGDNDTLRQIPHLRPRLESFAAVFRLRSHLTHFTHNFFNSASFYHVDTPVISENDCEGAGEVFFISSQSDEFFGEHKPYLQVSGQLHLEALASAIPQVYTLSPAFRADKSTGRFHMAEFRMLEAECAFMDSLEQLLVLVEDYLKYVVRRMNEEHPEEFEACKSVCEQGNSANPSEKILIDCLAGRFDHPLPRIQFGEALNILGRAADDWQRPLKREEELALVDQFGGPLFVTHFPANQKPFYMRQTEDGQFTESFDLLAPFAGELAGGSVREWDAEKLAGRLSQNGDVNKLGWYVELRRRGCARSAGFGLGMDRLMQSLVGIANVKDTIPFPRWFKSMRC